MISPSARDKNGHDKVAVKLIDNAAIEDSVGTQSALK